MYDNGEASPIMSDEQLREQLVLSRRSKVLLVVAVLFVLVNLVGGVMAALEGELVHTGLHAVLVLLGEFFVYKLASRRVAAY